MKLKVRREWYNPVVFGLPGHAARMVVDAITGLQRGIGRLFGRKRSKKRTS